MSDKNPHKYDVGVMTLILFDSRGRKTDSFIYDFEYTEVIKRGEERVLSGDAHSFVILRTLFNSADSLRMYPRREEALC